MADAFDWLSLIIWVLVSALVVLKGNGFESGRETFVRCLVATLLGWILLVVLVMVGGEIDIRQAASDAELEALARSDGAGFAAVLFFGWAPSLVLVLLVWALARAWRGIADRRRSHALDSGPRS